MEIEPTEIPAAELRDMLASDRATLDPATALHLQIDEAIRRIDAALEAHSNDTTISKPLD